MSTKILGHDNPESGKMPPKSDTVERKYLYLSERDNAIGPNNPRNRTFHVDGKRVSEPEFRAARSSGKSIKIVDTYQCGGVRHFDTIVNL